MSRSKILYCNRKGEKAVDDVSGDETSDESSGEPKNVLGSKISVDSARLLLKKWFEYFEENKDTFSQVGGGLDDDRIAELVDKMYEQMKGLEFNKKPVAEVFEELVTASDFIKLNDMFNEKYDPEGIENLYQWIENEISMSVMVVNRITNALKELSKKSQGNPDGEPEIDPGDESGGGSGGFNGWYQPCGNINKFGCKSDDIGQVQRMLGHNTPDNKFGPITQKDLGKYDSNFATNGFTHDDIAKISNLISKTNPSPQPSNVTTNGITDRSMKTPTRLPNPYSKGKEIGLSTGKSGWGGSNPLGVDKTPIGKPNPLKLTKSANFNSLSGKAKSPTFASTKPKVQTPKTAGKDLNKIQSKAVKRLSGRDDLNKIQTKRLNRLTSEDESPTNMSQGFVNESISNKEQKRINKEHRLDLKLNRK